MPSTDSVAVRRRPGDDAVGPRVRRCHGSVSRRPTPPTSGVTPSGPRGSAEELGGGRRPRATRGRRPVGDHGRVDRRGHVARRLDRVPRAGHELHPGARARHPRRARARRRALRVPLGWCGRRSSCARTRRRPPKADSGRRADGRSSRRHAAATARRRRRPPPTPTAPPTLAVDTIPAVIDTTPPDIGPLTRGTVRSDVRAARRRGPGRRAPVAARRHRAGGRRRADPPDAVLVARRTIVVAARRGSRRPHGRRRRLRTGRRLARHRRCRRRRRRFAARGLGAARRRARRAAGGRRRPRRGDRRRRPTTGASPCSCSPRRTGRRWRAAADGAWSTVLLPGGGDATGIGVSASSTVVTGTSIWRSTDGARSFEVTPAAPVLGAVLGVPGGFVAASCATGGPVLSPDGRVWTDLAAVHPRGVVPVAGGGCGTIALDEEGGVWLASAAGEPVVFRVREQVVDRLGVPAAATGHASSTDNRWWRLPAGIVVVAVPQPGGVATSTARSVTLPTDLELDAATIATSGAPPATPRPSPSCRSTTAASSPVSPRTRTSSTPADGSYRWTTTLEAGAVDPAGRLVRRTTGRTRRPERQPRRHRAARATRRRSRWRPSPTPTSRPTHRDRSATSCCRAATPCVVVAARGRRRRARAAGGQRRRRGRRRGGRRRRAGDDRPGRRDRRRRRSSWSATARGRGRSRSTRTARSLRSPRALVPTGPSSPSGRDAAGATLVATIDVAADTVTVAPGPPGVALTACAGDGDRRAARRRPRAVRVGRRGDVRAARRARPRRPDRRGGGRAGRVRGHRDDRHRRRLPARGTPPGPARRRRCAGARWRRRPRTDRVDRARPTTVVVLGLADGAPTSWPSPSADGSGATCPVRPTRPARAIPSCGSPGRRTSRCGAGHFRGSTSISEVARSCRARVPTSSATSRRRRRRRCRAPTRCTRRCRPAIGASWSRTRSTSAGSPTWRRRR